jgi:hypothetical protein
MDNNSLNTTKLKKVALIQLANDAFELSYPNFKFNTSEYDISAWANSKATVVKYRRIIRFTPLNKKDDNLRYDFEMDLINKTISPFDTWGMDKFYIPSSEEQAKIDFVVQSFGLSRFGFNNSIVEDEDMYCIHISNKEAFGKYFIDKETGKECMGSIEGSYNQSPCNPGLINPDPWVEICE